jgi:hypothetical protein
MHTKGKLVYQENSDAYTNIIRDSKGQFIVSTPQGTCEIHEANARRLVACWNACDGMPLLHLERLGEEKKGVMQLVAHREELRQERDELVKALRKAMCIGLFPEVDFNEISSVLAKYP